MHMSENSSHNHNSTKTQVAIIGSGPAGYTAAIYLSRAQLKPKLFAGMSSGGQLMYTTDLENFPGFPQGIKGPEFMQRLKKQAERFATSIVYQHVTAVDFSQQPFKLWTNIPEEVDPDIYQLGDRQAIAEASQLIKQTQPAMEAQVVIIATGATARRLHVPGEAKFIGKGVSTCAVCDAAFFKDKKVYVIGGGDSAMEDALALAKFTEQVTVVHRRDQLRASQIMQQRVLDHEGIDIMWNSELKAIRGDQVVQEVEIATEGQVQTLSADGVFLAIGHKPVSSIFDQQVQMDERGYIVTARSPSQEGVALAQTRLNDHGGLEYATMTSVPGVFAAGDVVDTTYRQAITAAGMGAAAALDAEKWL
jgi:thioredoxin reductase (NADPH)